MTVEVEPGVGNDPVPNNGAAVLDHPDVVGQVRAAFERYLEEDS